MGHLSENITRNLKRKSQAHHNNLLAEDTKIRAHNKRIEKARAILAKASSDVNTLIQQLQAVGPEIHSVQYARLGSLLGKARRSKETAQVKFEKEVVNAQLLRDSGSGKISVIVE
ncbi:hypothetical protein H0H92_003733 [Tricholoma furcatifolium]|nr:hypothetical protein H0H92_003733 [Tricholoma furcatifolium]